MLSENLKEVKERVARACERSGRNPSEVTVVAVSKMKPLSDIEELIPEGQLDFGENYVQELCEKDDQVSCPVNWHMIGHLQTNKVKYIINRTKLIHSVDSFKLAEKIDHEAEKSAVIADVLIQVNVAEEDTKYGCAYDETLALVRQISELPHVRVKGLMTSAPYVEDPEENRCYFRKLHELFVDILAKKVNNVDMCILSMGMTADYEVAVEEGSTMIRVGTGIFGERDYSR